MQFLSTLPGQNLIIYSDQLAYKTLVQHTTTVLSRLSIKRNKNNTRNEPREYKYILQIIYSVYFPQLLWSNKPSESNGHTTHPQPITRLVEAKPWGCVE